MPAGMVRPRASLAPTLGPSAIAAYHASGWRITTFGRVETGVQHGPCTRCASLCLRYGPHGHPFCDSCQHA